MRKNPMAINRRALLGMAGAGLGSVALAACGGPTVTDSGPNPGGSASGGAGAAPEPDFAGVQPAKKVTFWSTHPGGSEAVTKEIIAAFTQESGIEVELVTGGANYEEIAQKFQAAQQSGALPDLVVLSDVWWFRYYMQSSLLSLGTVLKAAEVDVADYRDSLVADYQYQGRQWAMPWGRSTPLFYYNKSHWKAAGLEDRAPKTWAEFAEWGPKLKSTNSGAQTAYQHGAPADYAGWVMQNVLWGHGGGWSKKGDFELTCDSPESVKALQFVKDTIYTNKWATVSAKSVTDDFSAGAASSIIASTGSLIGVQASAGSKFEVGVGFLPGGPVAQTEVCPTGGAGLGIPVKAKPENQLAAAKFYAFLTNPENAVKFSAATGYMPIRKSSDLSSMVAKNPLIETAVKQLEVTRTQDYARVFIPGADQEIAKACATFMTQDTDVTEAMTKLKATLQTMYDREVKPNL